MVGWCKKRAFNGRSLLLLALFFKRPPAKTKTTADISTKTFETEYYEVDTITKIESNWQELNLFVEMPSTEPTAENKF